MLIDDEFKDYEIISMSNGEKLERWGNYYLLRPDPEIIWEDDLDSSVAHAHYYRSDTGGGYWKILKELPNSWQVNYKDLTFNVKLMGFKHTGIFPEQASNWNFMMNKIKDAKREIKVLNLFAYTGCATACCLKAGASVVHVDSSKGMIDWAKENIKSSKLTDKNVRFLVDDCIKFVKKEIRRGNKYDAIIMDPPSFGRGVNKEIWSIDKDLFNLVSLCSNILSDNPLFFIINTYTAGLSKIVIEDILKLTIQKKYSGKITSYELGIKGNNELILPCGVCGRYEK